MKKNRMKIDPIMAEVRRFREEVSKEYHNNPKKFSQNTKLLMDELGMKYARIKPLTIATRDSGKKRKKD
ncbi:MAG: hypothetical protein HQK50_18105 [Oligoflexia bacterium]|nr:hypothetical protein [Oligoflexia bacterium]